MACAWRQTRLGQGYHEDESTAERTGTVKGVCPPPGPPPLHRTDVVGRFAYVDLVSREAMEKVVSRSEESFDGRRLLIKDGKSFEGRPVVKAQRYHAQSTTTQVGGGRRVENGEADAKAEEPQVKSEKIRKGKKKVTKEKVEV